MKAERNNDGTYSLTGITADQGIDLFQMVYDIADSWTASGDEMDEDEQQVYLRAYDLKDMIVEDMT